MFLLTSSQNFNSLREGMKSAFVPDPGLCLLALIRVSIQASLSRSLISAMASHAIEYESNPHCIVDPVALWCEQQKRELIQTRDEKDLRNREVVILLGGCRLRVDTTYNVSILIRPFTEYGLQFAWLTLAWP